MGKIKIPLCTFLLLMAFQQLCAQDHDGPARGIYFSKKAYVPVPLPSYAALKEVLPVPVLDDSPEYLAMYWRVWELAFEHFRRPAAGSPLVSNYIDEAFAPQIFQWDTFFMVLFSKYGYAAFPTITSLDNFYARQHENGYICREIREGEGEDFYFEGVENSVNPPLFAWTEVEFYRLSGERSRFAMVLPALEKYAEYLETGRRKAGTAHGLYWQTNLGSGMDNLPRSGSGWTDMSAQMVMMYRSLAFICAELGIGEKAKAYEARAAGIAGRINAFMWNEKEGLYFDIDDAGKQIAWKSAACFWPMLAGVASPAQCERMALHLKDPRSFWRAIPFATLAADQPGYRPDGDYWLGSVWAPTNVMIIKGLERMGFDEFATTASEAYLDGLYAVYKKTGTFWENYAPDALTRGSDSRPDFVGWTGCGPIQLLIENVLGIRADGATKTISWYLHRRDRHGIKKLHMGDATVSLIAARRQAFNSPAAITVTSDRPLTLKVLAQGGTTSYAIAVGTQTITVPGR